MHTSLSREQPPPPRTLLSTRHPHRVGYGDRSTSGRRGSHSPRGSHPRAATISPPPTTEASSSWSATTFTSTKERSPLRRSKESDYPLRHPSPAVDRPAREPKEQD